MKVLCREFPYRVGQGELRQLQVVAGLDLRYLYGEQGFFRRDDVGQRPLPSSLLATRALQ